MEGARRRLGIFPYSEAKVHGHVRSAPKHGCAMAACLRTLPASAWAQLHRTSVRYFMFEPCGASEFHLSRLKVARFFSEAAHLIHRLGSGLLATAARPWHPRLRYSATLA